MSTPEKFDHGSHRNETDWQRLEIPLPESDEDFNLYWCEMFNWVYGRGFYKTSIESTHVSRERISPNHFREHRVREYDRIDVSAEDEPALITGRLLRISPRSDTETTYKFTLFAVLSDVEHKINGWPISQHQNQEFIVPIIYGNSLILEYMPPKTVSTD